MNQEPTIFSKIIDRELPADILFENESVIVIKNINPVAPVHLLAITKKPFFQLHELLDDPSNKDILWELFSALHTVANQMGLSEDGYRITTNIGKNANQSVPHLHVHLIGGGQLPQNGL